MFLPSKEFQKQQRTLLLKDCENKIEKLLVFGLDYFNAFFPNSTISVINAGTQLKWPSLKVVQFKATRIKEYIGKLLKISDQICDELTDYVLPTESVSMPHMIKMIGLETCIKMLTYGRDLTDIDYFFLSDVGKVLDLDKHEIYSIIEQVLYDERKKIFLELKDYLSENQKETCAMLLIKAIRADNKVHPAEIKYFEIISDLLDNDQARLEGLYDSFDGLESGLPMSLSREVSEFLFKYLVEIVMCDKHYDPEETLFIKEIAEAFDLDQQQQDAILQPVTAALMVKADLFQQT